MKRLHLHMNIRQKIQYSFILIVCFSITVATYVASSTITGILEKNIMVYSQQLVNKTLENTEYYLTDIEELSKNISLDEQVTAILNDIRQNEDAVPDRQEELDTIIKKYQFLKHYITDISLFNEKTECMYNSAYDYKNSFFTQDWYTDYFKVSYDEYISGRHDSIIRGTGVAGTETFTFFKKIYDPIDPSVYLATMAIEMDTRILTESNVQIESNDRWATFIYNENDDLMFQSLPEGWTDKDWSIGEVLATNQDDHIMIRNQMSQFHWKIISVIPYVDLMQEVYTVRTSLIITGVVLVLLTIVFAGFISKSITNPLSTLMHTIKDIEDGDLEARAVIHSQDEIKKLGDVLNSMTANIKNLIIKNVEEEKLKRKAELNALQAQINPHFLYNTLDSVNWLALRKNEPEISNVLTSLGKFFRISLSKGNQFILIGQELEHIQHYINIQKFRHSNSFNTHIDIDDAIRGYYMPKLILQPIVENALIHGFKNKTADANINIRGYAERDHVFIVITDNGAGIQPHRLAEINACLQGVSQHTTGSYGLKNVNDRIQLYFGTQYGLTVESATSAGTRVTITFPILDEALADDSMEQTTQEENQ